MSHWWLVLQFTRNWFYRIELHLCYSVEGGCWGWWVGGYWTGLLFFLHLALSASSLNRYYVDISYNGVSEDGKWEWFSRYFLLQFPLQC